MASHLEKWEKDPFFPAAEEVQESADRMESTYRTWIHVRKDSSGLWNLDELQRDLHTALGTTKWQLEEFERAVQGSYNRDSVSDSKGRHQEFVIAMKRHISKVANSLNEAAISIGKPPRPRMHLDEGESQELALFLSGSKSSGDKNSTNITMKDEPVMGQDEFAEELPAEGRKNLSLSVELGVVEGKEGTVPGHRRTASASPDIGAWQIAVADDMSSNWQPEQPPRKIPSLSSFFNAVDSTSKFNLPRNGYRKLKLTDDCQEANTKVSHSHNLSKGINACYERNKSCLDSCDDCYDKQLYGWNGALQRLLQRSQYHMQYSRPIQMVFWIFSFIFLFVLVALHFV